jgi:uncharacterized membrane protein YbaN (DUF454 family)
VTRTIQQPTNKFIKYLLAFLGLVSLCLGILGIFLPLLPTTPFLLLSAALFMKSSSRLYNWLMNNRFLGKYLCDYVNHRTISIQSKIISITILWITILVSSIFVIEKIVIKIVLLIIAAAVTIHILSFKSTKE